ncbi:MAG: hypothetical protein AAGE65_00305 [Planctomycetota bacterium]
MAAILEDYIEQIVLYANRSGNHAEDLRRELRDHLSAKSRELEAGGMPREDALFRATRDHGNPKVVGYRLRPKWAWLDVRTTGTARGVVAVGPRAVGVLAIGGVSVGVFSFGGLSVGLFGIGGLLLTAFLGWGGIVVTPFGLAYGGMALGLLAMGGFAAGAWAGGAVDASLWAFDTMPGWLRYGTSPFQHYWGHLVFQCAMLGVMSALMVFSTLVDRRERLRIGEPRELTGY